MKEFGERSGLTFENTIFLDNSKVQKIYSIEESVNRAEAFGSFHAPYSVSFFILLSIIFSLQEVMLRSLFSNKTLIQV